MKKYTSEEVVDLFNQFAESGTMYGDINGEIHNIHLFSTWLKQKEQSELPVKGQIIFVRNDNDVDLDSKPIWQAYNFDHFNAEGRCVVSSGVFDTITFDNYSLTNPIK